MTEGSSNTDSAQRDIAEKSVLEEVDGQLVYKAKNNKRDSFRYPLIKDVIMPPDLAEAIDEARLCMIEPEMIEIMGVSVPRVLLFVGDTGLGKSFTYRALRNQVGLTKPIEEFTFRFGADGSKYINETSNQVNHMFERGLELAQQGYTVLYWFDEAHQILYARGNVEDREDEKVTDALMDNLERVVEFGSKEFVFLASNFTQVMDAAAVRSGRINRVIEFPDPTPETLAQAYEREIFRIQQRAGYDVFAEIDVARIVEASGGFNYADVHEVVVRSVQKTGYEAAREHEQRSQKGVGVLTLPCVEMETLLDVIRAHGVNRSRFKRKIKQDAVGFGSGQRVYNT